MRGSQVALFVRGNDFDPDGDSITLVEVSNPAHGTSFISSGIINYTPDAGFSGVETITYTIRDTHGLTATGLLTVLVGTTGDRPPVAQSASYSVQAGGTLPITLSAVDPNGQPLTWTLVTPPVGQLTGSLTGAAPQLTYTAPTNRPTDAFVYEVSDGTLTAQATITITILRPNIDPVADDDSATTTQETPITIDVLANDTDADGDILEVYGWTAGSHGSVLCSVTECTYTPEPGYFGSDTFTYYVRDGFGGQAEATVTVTIEPSPIAASLDPATPTTGPGATSINLADIPYERMRQLDVDVSNAPFADGHRSRDVHRSPTVAVRDDGRPSPISPRSRNGRQFASAPLSEIPVDYPGGWPALLQGTSLAGVPTQSITLEEFLALYELTPVPPALQGLTLDDISFFDGTSLANGSPAAFLLGATPIADISYGTQPWCLKLAADTNGGATCTSLGVGPATTLLELDADEAAAAVLAELPELRRVALKDNFDAFVDAPVTDARLNELNLFATDIGQVGVGAAIGASAAVGSVLISDIPVNDTNPDDGAYGRRNLVVDCSSGFDCSGGATLGAAQAAGALRPDAKLQDVGRAFFDRTVAGNPPISLAQIAAALPTTLDVNDVIVGSLDQSDFPWEDVDLTTAGLQDFARTGATLDWNLRLNIDSSRAGAGPFDTTVTVTLPPGFRNFAPTPARPAPAALNTFTPAAGAVTGPVASDGPDGQILTWTIADVAVDTDYTLSFRTTPGLTLGQARAVAKVQVSSGAATTSGVVGVVDTGDASAEPGSALPVASNVLYLGYVDRPDDLDLYGFDSTPLAQVGVRLSHLAGDGDLVVYGPATDRPENSPSPVATRTATPAAPPLVAEDFDISGSGYSPEPDTDAGVPLIDGLTVIGRSAARNTDLEAVDAFEPDLLQVSSYNSSTSNQPYVLRVREVDPLRTPTCPAYARTGGVARTLPDLTTLPSDLSTVILVNAQRLGDTFGPTADTLRAVDVRHTISVGGRCILPGGRSV